MAASGGTIAEEFLLRVEPAGAIGMDTLPLWTWFLGALLLGLALIYGIMRNRRRTPGDRILTNEATRQNYRDENRRSGA